MEQLPPFLSSATSTTTSDAPLKHHPNIAEAPANLPTEIILLILLHLDHRTFLAATATCRRWCALARRYRQYLWKHLSWRDFSFTAGRGLWKLEFLKDRDLRQCFPLSEVALPPAPSSTISHSNRKPFTRTSVCGSCQRLPQRTGSTSSSPSMSPNVGADRHINVNASERRDTGDTCSCARRANRNRRRRANDGAQNWKEKRDRDPLTEADSVDEDLDDERFDLRRHEQDWKTLYQLTSNWYQGRAKGYCPLMLPSLTTLASATQALSGTGAFSSSCTSFSSPASSSSSPSCKSVGLDLGSGKVLGRPPSSPVQRAIRRILRKRKPMAVVGLQIEGSSSTGLSLASFSTCNLDPQRNSETDKESEASCDTRKRQVALIRSNPHYRERRQPNGASHSSHFNPLIHSVLNINNTDEGTGSAVQDNLHTPNIMVQDPQDHGRVKFAVRAVSTSQTSISSSSSSGGVADVGQGGLSATLTTDVIIPESQQHQLTPQDHQAVPQGSQDIASSSPLNGMHVSDDPADDILCHYSSPLHSFLVTGHMNGSVRLWDMSIQEPKQQCIRHWQSGARRRVLCVGLNSRVVVCGNADSTLCVWDIHSNLTTALSSHGTIHSASYLTSTTWAESNDWNSGIQHICVGDSLVACSTESSGSVLVFSLATGSLVYEISGLCKPVKMCMTDFFLLTEGRSTWNRVGDKTGMYPIHQHRKNDSTAHNPFGSVDMDGEIFGSQSKLQLQDEASLSAEEYASCCVDIWDLRTGDRLYSLIPRLPTHQLYQGRNMVSIVNDHPPLHGRSYKRGMNCHKQQGNPLRTTPSTGVSLPSGHEDGGFRGSRDISANTSWGAAPGLVIGRGEGSHARRNVEINSATVGSAQPTAQKHKHKHITSTVQSSLSSLSPIPVPLRLLGIAVTPDHSTLVVTLREQSGEGREGVYCWDFSGSRLETYHEQGTEISTVIMDKSDLEYYGGQDSEKSTDTEDGTVFGELCTDHDDEEDSEEDSEEEDGQETDFYSNDRFNNNMVMQQVDSTVFKNLHQARITGKVWIGWQLEEYEFRRRKSVH